MRYNLLSATLLITASAISPALAVPVIDQSFTTTPGGTQYTTANDFQQGLTVGVTGLLTSVQLWLSNFSGSAKNIEVRIAEGSAGTVQSSWLFDKKITTVPKNGGAWYSVAVNSSNINVSAGENLIVDVFDYTSPGASFGYASSNTGSYIYSRPNQGLPGTPTPYTLFGGGGYEMDFQTFVEPSSISEPPTVAILCMGLFGLFFARRHRLSRALCKATKPLNSIKK